MSCSSSQILIIAVLVGFFGDALLQILVAAGMGGKTGWGLRDYFQQHGRAESLFIAAGMMALFFVIYLLLKLPLKFYLLAIYGIILDILFRVIMVFPSLRGYYKALNPFYSALWGAIPMMLPLFICSLLSRGHP